MQSVIPIALVGCLIIIDILTGIAKGFKTGTFKSSAMREGMYSKFAELFLCCFMYGLRYALPYIGVHTSIPFVEMTTAYIGVMEISSVFENLGSINPAISKFLEGIFDEFKKGEKK